MNTFESQAWARNFHPNDLFAEATDGGAAYLTDGGKAQLRGLTAQKAEHFKRFRPDVFKAGKSPRVMREIEAFAQLLEDENNEEQADLVRYLGGFVKSRAEGTTAIEDKDVLIKLFKGENQEQDNEQDSDVK
jgi:hypothetical protein